MIDRTKYSQSEDYRNGYQDGLKDGKSQILAKYHTYMYQLNENFSRLTELLDAEGESE